MEICIIQLPAPALSSSVPNRTKRNTKLVDTPSALMPHVKGGKIKAMGLFSANRLPAAPEVPTIAEAGGPALQSSTWVMFLAPAGVPRDIVNRMAAEVAKAVASPDIKGRFEALGIEPVVG